MADQQDDGNHQLAASFRDFIRQLEFPCVGAKSALSHDQISFVIARDIRSSWDDLRIIPRLQAFARSYHENPALFQSFVVVFEQPETMSEAEFERHLWRRIQSLSDKDSWLGAAPDDRVASDPTDHNFSLSFGGEAFFVVGLHPGASRPARRFSRPVLVFNPHDQFERLRSQGLYEKMRNKILERDLVLAGTANPMLRRHGEGSEARQYSGRIVGNDWRCPYEAHDFRWVKRVEE